MSRVFSLLFILLSFQSAFGTTVIPTDYIYVALTNAGEHDISFSYSPTNEYVTVIMPYTKAEQSFDGAFLKCTNSSHLFDIPIKGLHPVLGEGDKDVILISFRMDRELARECTLTIFFTKGSAKGTMYILSLKDFVPAHKSANKGTGAYSRPASPFDAGLQFVSAPCAPPSLSAAVAQFCRSP